MIERLVERVAAGELQVVDRPRLPARRGGRGAHATSRAARRSAGCCCAPDERTSQHVAHAGAPPGRGVQSACVPPRSSASPSAPGEVTRPGLNAVIRAATLAARNRGLGRRRHPRRLQRAAQPGPVPGGRRRAAVARVRPRHRPPGRHDHRHDEPRQPDGVPRAAAGRDVDGGRPHRGARRAVRRSTASTPWSRSAATARCRSPSACTRPGCASSGCPRRSTTTSRRRRRRSASTPRWASPPTASTACSRRRRRTAASSSSR